ncbi:hypothetical protein KAR91_13005 [Candidatus Pacearchaeota archaeon]|nr:hypothetical protein [Candidatus Pacearchaeota archaeon]
MKRIVQKMSDGTARFKDATKRQREKNSKYFVFVAPGHIEYFPAAKLKEAEKVAEKYGSKVTKLKGSGFIRKT